MLQISKVSRELERIWVTNSGTEILFVWTSFLQNDLLDFLDMQSLMILNGTQLPTVLQYNLEKKEKVFNVTAFTCLVCFREKAGSSCLQFAVCEHVFCKACMKDYFEIQIRDGNVKCLACPADKCQSQAHPAQVIVLIHFYIVCFRLGKIH